LDNIIELRHLTILFADDDKVYSEATKRTLELLFDKVYHAKDGKEALALYHEHNIHIMMLDVRMGDISGIEVAQTIRKHNSKIPIFLASSYTQTDELLASCTLHLVNYLVKPFSFQKLLETLNACLEQIREAGLMRISFSKSVVYDPFQKMLYEDDVPSMLTRSEISVLELLIAYKGHVVSYERFYTLLGEDSSHVALKNIILKLRKKIGEEHIINLSKMGYLLT
jgi:DNA-binding response OmpR family regulator